MNPNLAELLKGLDSGLADIREKLVEEPWYGRPLGDGGPAYGIETKEKPGTAPDETVQDAEILSPDPQPRDWVTRVALEPPTIDPSDLQGGVDLER